MLIRPYDRDELKAQFEHATPFPHVAIEGFLEPGFAAEVAEAFPTFEEAAAMGRKFSGLNELDKVQVTDSSLFPDPIKLLNDALAAPEFLEDLVHITGIPKLLADELLAGGGIHVTGPRGRLDVHVDFNYLRDRKLYRRLNLLLYLNPKWERDWGGAVEIWDEDIEVKHGAFAPVMNRCVMFETSSRSFHGVEPVTCPAGFSRNSFATYYYTREPPPDYTGKNHGTLFKARPDEKLRKYVLMPAERAKEAVKDARGKARDAKNKIKGLIKRDD